MSGAVVGAVRAPRTLVAYACGDEEGLPMDERTRAWIYRVGAVAILVLVAVDVAQGGDAAGWVAWIAGAIGLGSAGLAAANTSTRDGRTPRPPSR